MDKWYNDQISRNGGAKNNVKGDKNKKWMRLPHETLEMWGDRLDRAGLLDNPDVRWKYQQGVWGDAFGDIWHSIRNLFRGSGG